MALNNTTADAVATAICTALSITDVATVATWKTIMEKIYAGLKTDIAIAVTVTSVSGVTVGGAVSGPGTGTGVPL